MSELRVLYRITYVIYVRNYKQQAIIQCQKFYSILLIKRNLKRSLPLRFGQWWSASAHQYIELIVYLKEYSTEIGLINWCLAHVRLNKSILFAVSFASFTWVLWHSDGEKKHVAVSRRRTEFAFLPLIYTFVSSRYITVQLILTILKMVRNTFLFSVMRFIYFLVYSLKVCMSLFAKKKAIKKATDRSII